MAEHRLGKGQYGPTPGHAPGTFTARTAAAPSTGTPVADLVRGRLSRKDNFPHLTGPAMDADTAAAIAGRHGIESNALELGMYTHHQISTNVTPLIEAFASGTADFDTVEDTIDDVARGVAVKVLQRCAHADTTENNPAIVQITTVIANEVSAQFQAATGEYRDLSAEHSDPGLALDSFDVHARHMALQMHTIVAEGAPVRIDRDALGFETAETVMIGFGEASVRFAAFGEIMPGFGEREPEEDRPRAEGDVVAEILGHPFALSGDPAAQLRRLERVRVPAKLVPNPAGRTAFYTAPDGKYYKANADDWFLEGPDGTFFSIGGELAARLTSSQENTP